jgi:uncharacterized protein YndB with AHSA1/START domain
VIDIINEVNAIRREVGTTGEEVAVVVRRSYPAAVEDVWSALTEPDRIRRWFLPVKGDLRIGGQFQLEGNAGGEILECEPPVRFKVTFGGPTSLVELRLEPGTEDGTTVLSLEHTVPIDLAGGGAGALYAGPGWDLAFVALGAYFRGESPAEGDPNSPEIQRLSQHSVRAWVAVITDSGTATAEDIAAATDASLAQFAPDLPR